MDRLRPLGLSLGARPEGLSPEGINRMRTIELAGAMKKLGAYGRTMAPLKCTAGFD